MRLREIDGLATEYPWSLELFRTGLEGNDFGWGVDISNRLVAFALFNRVLDEATLLNVATDPAFQRHGYAKDLLTYALRELSASATRCLLEVRSSNAPAMALYEKLGFAYDGSRRNYYPAHGGREDAVLMSANLGIHFSMIGN